METHTLYCDKLSGNTRFRRTNSMETPKFQADKLNGNTQVPGGQTQWKHPSSRRTNSMETPKFQADNLNGNRHVPSGRTPWKHASRTYSRYSTHTHTPTGWSLPNVPCVQRTSHTVRRPFRLTIQYEVKKIPSLILFIANSIKEKKWHHK